jgi:hypothetical protein
MSVPSIRRAPRRTLSRIASPTRRSRPRAGLDYDAQIKSVWRMCADGRISFQHAGRWTDALIKTRDERGDGS